MKFNREERLEIGRRIYEGELTKYEAEAEYGISYNTAREYMRAYRDLNDLAPKSGPRSTTKRFRMKAEALPQGVEEMQSMSKEELIDALITAKINEARLKKGYLVEGAGVEKRFIPIDKKNTK